MAEPVSIPGQGLDSDEMAPRANPRDVPPALPEEASPANNPRLNQTAESIGTAVGSTVREMKSRFRVVKGGAQESIWSTTDDLKQRAGETVEQAKQRASEAVQQASSKASEVLDNAKERASAAMDTARAKASESMQAARNRAAYLKEEYPMQVVMGAAAAGFVLGVVLRIWRSNRG